MKKQRHFEFELPLNHTAHNRVMLTGNLLISGEGYEKDGTTDFDIDSIMWNACDVSDLIRWHCDDTYDTVLLATKSHVEKLFSSQVNEVV